MKAGVKKSGEYLKLFAGVNKGSIRKQGSHEMLERHISSESPVLLEIVFKHPEIR